MQLSDEIIARHFPDPTSQQLIKDLRDVGDALNKSRRKLPTAPEVVAGVNAGGHGFTLEFETITEEVEGTPPSFLRVATGLNQPGETTPQRVFSRDKIKIKSKHLKDIRFDSAANFMDDDPNWAVHKNIKDADGNITHACIYMPRMGEFYFADKDKATRIRLPQYADEALRIEPMTVPPLDRKFAAEYSSFHTKERSLFKALFTTMVREEIGGSLHETGMKEAPSVWVGTGARGLCFAGNLEKNNGGTGAFIAEKSGAVVIREKITTDSKQRDVLFVMHPKIAGQVLEKFTKAERLARGDVQISRTHMLFDPHAKEMGIQ